MRGSIARLDTANHTLVNEKPISCGVNVTVWRNVLQSATTKSNASESCEKAPTGAQRQREAKSQR